MFARYTAGVPLVSNRTFLLARGFTKNAENGSIEYAGLSVNHKEAKQDPGMTADDTTRQNSHHPMVIFR